MDVLLIISHLWEILFASSFLFFNFLCITDCETVSLHLKPAEWGKLLSTKQGSQIQNHSLQYFQRDCLMDFVRFEIFSAAPCWTVHNFLLPVLRFPFFSPCSLDMESHQNWKISITYKDSMISGLLPVLDLGEGPRGPPPLIIGYKKKKWLKEEKLAGQVK